MDFRIKAHDALDLVDLSKTFMPGGGLAVSGGDRIVKPISGLIERWPNDLIFATRDLHPWGHITLASSWERINPDGSVSPVSPFTLVSGGFIKIRPAKHALFTMAQAEYYLRHVKGGSMILWPDHGLVDTEESRLHPELDLNKIKLVFPKGMDPACDCNSGLRDNMGRPTGLGDIMREVGVRRHIIVGLAFDVCVGMFAKDAKKLEYEVVVVTDLCRSVTPEGEAKMKNELLDMGVRLATLSNIMI
jgi:nicotinamidase/pyrazinamidase